MSPSGWPSGFGAISPSSEAQYSSSVGGGGGGGVPSSAAAALNAPPSVVSPSVWFDWLRLLALGLVAEYVRRNLDTLAQQFFSVFYVEATFRSKDPSFNWILLWITNNPSWRQSRYVNVGTLSAGGDNGASLMGVAATYSTKRSDIFTLPEASVSYRLWYGPHLLTFCLEEQKTDGNSTQSPRVLRLRIYTLGGQSVLADILEEAETAYRKLELDTVNIYRPDTTSWTVGTWIRVCSKRTRPIDSVILDEGKAEWIAQDVKEFIESRNWYRQRGIPFHRGYLLYGPPGTGKTSLVAALAAELKLDIYLLNLGNKLDDATLTSLLARVPSTAILLVEDIDATQRKISDRRDFVDRHLDVQDDDGIKRVTLAGLLNALDGIDASEGQIVFATTNHREVLDPALCRPGRMDVHVKFDLASRYQAKALFRRFYPESEFGVTTTTTASRAQTDGGLAEGLFMVMGEDEMLRGHGVQSGGEATADLLLDLDDHNAPPLITVIDAEGVACSSTIDALANRFSQLIPERKCTMAMLQEYLMRFKTDPIKACSEYEIRKFVASLVDDESDDEAATTVELWNEEKGGSEGSENGAIGEQGRREGVVDHEVPA